MQICNSLQADNHNSTPPLRFVLAGCPSCHPTNSDKALKTLLLLLLLLLLQLFSGHFSWTTSISWYQKSKTSLDLNEAWDDGVWGWQWHQLDHMQTICTSLQTDNHTNTSSVNFYRPHTLPDAKPTMSKHQAQGIYKKNKLKENSWRQAAPFYHKCSSSSQWFIITPWGRKKWTIFLINKYFNTQCNLTKLSTLIVNEYYHQCYLFNFWNLH